MGMCGEIAPVKYEVQRGNPQQQGQFFTVYTGEEVGRTQSPAFKPAVISFTTLANSNDMTPIRFRLMCGRRCIGYIDTTTAGLLDKRNFDLMAG